MAVLMVVGILPLSMLTGIFSSKVVAATKTYSFDATALTTEKDKETISGKVAEDYVTVFGTVQKRVKKDTVTVIATELAKSAQSGYEFTVTGTATAKIVISSTGGSNESQFTLIDAKGEAVASKDGKSVISVTGTTGTEVNYELEAGTYKMVSAKEFTSRGVRVISFDITETTSGTRPPRADWAEVAAPTLGDVKVNGGKITVPYTMSVGYDGADELVVSMKDSKGNVVKTETVAATGTSGEVVFAPEISDEYTFVAVASRKDCEDKTCEAKKVAFELPLATPVISSVTSKGDGKIEVVWSAVKEASSYNVYVDGNKVDSTKETSYTVSGLTVGNEYSFAVEAVRETPAGISSKSEVKKGTATADAQRAWGYVNYGNGASDSNAAYTGDLNEDGQVTLRSGSLNKEGKFDSKSSNNGKIVPASFDGLNFYYTTVPVTQNFTLRAKVSVKQWMYTNGQEGFGIMATDMLGGSGWNNSYMASVTKVEYYSNVDEETGEATVSKTSGEKISMKLGIGSQEKIGVNKNNLSKLLDNDSDTVNNEFKTTMSTLETSKLGSAAGTFNLIGNYSNTDATFEGTTVENPITEVKLTIQKNNTGYFVSYTDAEGNTTTKKYYDTEALSQIDSDNVYVGMFASRTFDVTYSDISLTTIDPADDAPAEERPVEYKDIQVSVTSSSTASSEDYTFKGMSNADGHVVVTKGDDVIGETDVTANESFTIDTKLVAGDNKFVATFTPDENFKFGEYELPTSYDPIEVSKIVTYAYFTGDLIYVSADATKAVDEAKANETYSAKAQINSGKGTKDNPIDIYNAVAYARPGQKILLLDGDYKVANNLLIPFGIDGTDEKPIYLMSESSDSRVVLDFEGTTGEGITLCGNYWYIQNVDVTNSANGKDGIHVCGSHNVLDTVNTYKNGNTGIQISRYSSAQDKADWPAYNTIKNCTSHNNADAGYEDADGFAAKLTIGKGNVFVGCIAHHNADDGWDFFAKVETGNIPSVVIMNCVAYGNGYIESENGLIDAGNGNGFKMGGSSLPGSHVIINSVAFDNKAKGIDSNSCPDNVVVGCTSFNNENSNVALYTNDAKNTNYRTNGIISYRNAYVKVADNLKARGTQDTAKLYDATDYYWLSASGDAKEASTLLTDANFVTLNTNDVKVTRNANGTINMNGLGMLTADTRKALGVGIGADSLDKAPQLTSEGYALVIDALGYDEANRVLGLSLESAFILRDGAEGALTGDSNNIAVMVVLLLASMAVAGGAIVYSKKRKVVSK